jgi:cell wall-associated NlpC family hydrolase
MKRDEIGYTQSSSRWEGIRDRIRPPRIPRWGDCSSTVEWINWVIGAPCPSGNNFQGGYTGTQIKHGKRVANVSATELCNLVFYSDQGGGVPSHVAYVIGKGRVVSHGSMGGPYLLPYNYRHDINQERNYF